MKFTIAVGVIAAASCASAFVVPAAPVRSVTRVNGLGKYDGQLWDSAAKDDIKSMYDPSQPRSDTNFDPFETASLRAVLYCLMLSSASVAEGGF